MKKIAIFSILCLAAITNLFALEVSRDELQSSQQETIEFINYTGPHKVIDSLASIKGIGSDLGKEIAKDVSASSKSGNSARYSVIHAIDPETKEKLDADIIIIGNDATVDHIKNLRRIISAYLSSAYGYTEADADTLAVFITVYNAVYRGKLSALQGKYKDIVIQNLSEDICGLSVNYKDWPGKSQIIIPLFDVNNGGLSTVDTSVISDTNVVKSMKEDDDKNVESRKEMVDIKERESEAASEKAKESQKQAVEEERKAKEEKAKTEAAQKEADAAQKEADAAQKEADEKQKIADENPDDKEAQEEAKEAQEEADAAQEEADQKQAAADEQKAKQEEQEEKAQESKEEAAKQQEVADKKQSEAQSERKDIAKDQNEVQKREAEEAKMPVEYGIVLTDEAQLLSRLVRFNKETGEVLKNSPVAQIRNRTVFKEGDNYIAIAGGTGKNEAIRLVTISTESLEITAESDYTISSDSVLVQSGSDYFCVIDEKGKFYLGKFGNDLSLKLKSEIEVNSKTPLTLAGNEIVVTDSKGGLKVLSTDDLKPIDQGK